VFWGVKLRFQVCGSDVSKENNGGVLDSGTIRGDTNHKNVWNHIFSDAASHPSRLRY